MIKKVVAATGRLVLEWEGYSLSSKKDPIKEAMSSLGPHLPMVNRAESILILGALSGYQISFLLEKHPKKRFLVVEKNDEIRKAVQEIHGFCMVHVQWLKDLNQEETVLRSALSKSYHVLPLFSCVKPLRFLYQLDHERLLGRTRASYQWLNDIRPRGSLDVTEEPVSVLNLKPLSKIGHSRDFKILSALRELVA